MLVVWSLSIGHCGFERNKIDTFLVWGCPLRMAPLFLYLGIINAMTNWEKYFSTPEKLAQMTVLYTPFNDTRMYMDDTIYVLKESEIVFEQYATQDFGEDQKFDSFLEWLNSETD